MACDTYTVLMVHADGADGSTSFPDSSLSAHAITAHGNAQNDTAQFATLTGNSASALFDGTGDYLTTPNSTDFDMGTGDFTIDFWLRFNSTSVVQNFCGANESLGTNTLQVRYNNINGQLQMFMQGLTYAVAWTPSTATWYHVAVTRSGTSMRAFINGTQLGATQTSSDNIDCGTDYSIGSVENGTSPLNGWIDEFRLSKGIARWTANFTPPTAEYCLGSAFKPRMALLGVG